MGKKVKDFNEGERVNTTLLISQILRGTTNSGSPYLTLTLQDSTKSIEAKLWDIKPELEKQLEVGKVYDFDIEVIKYKNNPKIVSGILNFYANSVYEYPAAAKIHHNFIGGLATHTSGMIKVAAALCSIYPSLDKDYLIAGVIIHDLGKIEELSSPVVTEYTKAGKLLGHISIIDARLLQVGKDLGLEDSEELLLLRHMALSHHGQMEYGSPVRPETLEAEILNLVDNIDARINTIDKALSEIKEGEFTPKIFALENRVFNKHK